MLFVRACQTLLLTAALGVVPAYAAHSHRAPTAGRHSKPAKSKTTLHGPRQIDSDRAREIQGALIREKYMDGEPTGQWDQQSQAAMQRFQADNGWQTKLTPDSRALIKLGLGPSHDGVPPAGHAASAQQTASSTLAPAASATRTGAQTASAGQVTAAKATKTTTLADMHSIAN